MKFSCSQERIAKALSIVGRSVSTRSTLPVLGNVLIMCDASGLYFAATNLSIMARVWVPANIEQTGGITLPARLLQEVINSLPPERVDMELTAKTQSVSLRCGRFTTTIKGIDYLDFPAVTQWDGATVTLAADLFARAIDQVTVSASIDESRPTLTGIEMEAKSGLLKMAATDGFRLSLRQIEQSAEVEKFIIPCRSLDEVARIAGVIKPKEIEMALALDKNQIGFRMHNDALSVELYCSLIDAKFPDYRAIVPKNHTTRLVCDTAELLRVVSAAMIFAKDNANIVRFAVTGQSVKVTGSSNESGEALSELGAEIEGNPLEIAVDGKMLLDAIRVMDGSRMVLEMTLPTRPILARAVSDNQFVYIQMPMQPK